MDMITSTNNFQIKNLIQLQKKAKERKEQGVFVCEGIKMFEEARQAAGIIKAYVSESLYEELIRRDPAYFEGLSYEIVSDTVFKETAETVTPQGILCVVRQPVYTLEDITDGEKVWLLLLEDLRDPGNLGTILRTAEGAGVTGVILSRESVDMFNPKVIRSTMGAVFRVPFLYVESFIDTLTVLKQKDICIFAAHLSGAVDYDKADYGGKTAILIGNEANGLSEESTKAAKVRVRIPMEGKLESLNAAVAAALFMYERYRQGR